MAKVLIGGGGRRVSSGDFRYELFRPHCMGIMGSLSHIASFNPSTRIMSGRKAINISLDGRGMRSARERDVISELYRHGVHPWLASAALSAIDHRMIDMYNDLQEIADIDLGRIKNIRNLREFYNMDAAQKVAHLREIKMVGFRTVDPLDRERREWTRHEEAVKLMAKHNPEYRQLSLLDELRRQELFGNRDD
jgi:hypothetical protein